MDQIFRNSEIHRKYLTKEETNQNLKGKKSKEGRTKEHTLVSILFPYPLFLTKRGVDLQKLSLVPQPQLQGDEVVYVAYHLDTYHLLPPLIVVLGPWTFSSKSFLPMLFMSTPFQFHHPCSFFCLKAKVPSNITALAWSVGLNNTNDLLLQIHKFQTSQ